MKNVGKKVNYRKSKGKKAEAFSKEENSSGSNSNNNSYKKKKTTLLDKQLLQTTKTTREIMKKLHLQKDRKQT